MTLVDTLATVTVGIQAHIVRQVRYTIYCDSGYTITHCETGELIIHATVTGYTAHIWRQVSYTCHCDSGYTDTHCDTHRETGELYMPLWQWVYRHTLWDRWVLITNHPGLSLLHRIKCFDIYQEFGCLLPPSSVWCHLWMVLYMTWKANGIPHTGFPPPVVAPAPPLRM